MTTSHSSGRRHRGRRGRRSRNRGGAQQPQEQLQQEQVILEQETLEFTVAMPDLADEPPPVPERPRERPEAGPAQPRPPRQDTRAPRGNRRRQQPRQPVGPMPAEVLRKGLQVGAAEHPLQLRPVGGMVDEKGANFGCPMLSRLQTAMPATGNQPAPRCSLGWSVHNEDEAMLCMLTPELNQCWKAHPENIERLRETYERDQEVLAAD